MRNTTKAGMAPSHIFGRRERRPANRSIVPIPCRMWWVSTGFSKYGHKFAPDHRLQSRGWEKIEVVGDETSRCDAIRLMDH